MIEAVFEKMSVKNEVFAALDKVCKSGTILASNTSTLDINEIAMSISRPKDVISRMGRYQIALSEYGRHWFTPSSLLSELVEENRGFASIE